MALLNQYDTKNLFPETIGSNLSGNFANVISNNISNSLCKIESIFINNPTTITNSVSLVLNKSYRVILPNNYSSVILSNFSISANTTNLIMDKNSYITLQENEYIQGMSTPGNCHIIISSLVMY
jgi:hypothetical protein